MRNTKKMNILYFGLSIINVLFHSQIQINVAIKISFKKRYLIKTRHYVFAHCSKISFLLNKMYENE